MSIFESIFNMGSAHLLASILILGFLIIALVGWVIWYSLQSEDNQRAIERLLTDLEAKITGQDYRLTDNLRYAENAELAAKQCVAELGRTRAQVINNSDALSSLSNTLNTVGSYRWYIITAQVWFKTGGGYKLAQFAVKTCDPQQLMSTDPELLVVVVSHSTASPEFISTATNWDTTYPLYSELTPEQFNCVVSRLPVTHMKLLPIPEYTNQSSDAQADNQQPTQQEDTADGNN